MKYTALILITCLAFSCKKAKHNPECKNSNTDFFNLYNNLSGSHKYEETYDTEIHEYSFTLSEQKSICEIGYQSQRKIKNTPYLIEIINNSDSSVVLSESHKFKHNKTSYFIPNHDVTLEANTSYSIRRIQNNYNTFSDIIGHVATSNSMEFPYVSGIITVTGSNFYQRGGPIVDRGIPFIDIVFK